MKKNKKVLSIGVLLILIIVVIIYGRGKVNASTPEKTVNKLINAINDKNVVQVIECFTLDKQEKINTIANGVESLTDISISKYIQWIPIISNFIEDPIPTLHVKINSKEQDKYTAKLYVTVSADDISVDGIIYMVKQEKSWLIDEITK